jgi:glycosyltransferase involved in cell wall biosynthesis
MKVLFVHQNLIGLADESAESRQTVQSLLRQGITVGALYRRYDEQAIDASYENYVDLGCADLSYHTLEDKITDFKPDIAHIKSCWTPSHARAARIIKKLGIPYVVEPGGHLFPIHLTIRFAGRPLELWRRLFKYIYQNLIDGPMIRGASAIRGLSHFEASYCRNRFGVESFALHLGINQEWYEPNPKVRYATNDAVVQFLFIGRLDIFQKGIDLILEASRKLVDDGYGRKFHVVIAGPPLGDSDLKIRETIRINGLNDCVSVEPPARDTAKNALFNASHVFIHPSRFEEMAKLPREAVATGLPVIASRESNFGDWVEQEGFGIAAELSSHSLAAAMLRFISDKSLISECSQAAIIFSRKNSWESVATSLVSHYNVYLSQ